MCPAAYTADAYNNTNAIAQTAAAARRASYDPTISYRSAEVAIRRRAERPAAISATAIKTVRMQMYRDLLRRVGRVYTRYTLPSPRVRDGRMRRDRVTAAGAGERSRDEPRGYVVYTGAPITRRTIHLIINCILVLRRPVLPRALVYTFDPRERARAYIVRYK